MGCSYVVYTSLKSVAGCGYIFQAGSTTPISLVSVAVREGGKRLWEPLHPDGDYGGSLKTPLAKHPFHPMMYRQTGGLKDVFGMCLTLKLRNMSNFTGKHMFHKTVAQPPIRCCWNM